MGTAQLQGMKLIPFFPSLFFLLLLFFLIDISVPKKIQATSDDNPQLIELAEELDREYTFFSKKNHAESTTFDVDFGADMEWGMVKRRGNHFMVGDKSFYFNGFNTYWLMIFAVDESTKNKVTDVFKQARTLGLSVCRTWAFNDGGWRALQRSPSIYDEDVFKALDFVVSEAKKYKIRLLLSLVNNWDAYGGKGQYVKWGKEAGLNLSSDDDFFSDQTMRDYYKAHVKKVLTRVNTFTNITYKDDPTIFAWELMNEPRCLSDPSGDQLQAWIQEMAVYVKSIDPVHMVEIGLEGFYGPSSQERVQFNPNSFAQQVGTDFIRNHQSLGIDFASVHMYADSWVSQTISDAHIQFVKTWMQAHIDDADTVLDMPVVFSEFGVSRKEIGYNSSFRDTFYRTVYGEIMQSIKKGGSAAGSMFWELFPEGTEYMDDGYAITMSKDSSASNIISLQSTRMMLFNSLCSTRCRLICRKRHPLEDFMYHNEL